MSDFGRKRRFHHGQDFPTFGGESSALPLLLVDVVCNPPDSIRLAGVCLPEVTSKSSCPRIWAFKCWRAAFFGSACWTSMNKVSAAWCGTDLRATFPGLGTAPTITR
jgi:hypothetical protein